MRSGSLGIVKGKLHRSVETTNGSKLPSIKAPHRVPINSNLNKESITSTKVYNNITHIVFSDNE